MRTGTLLADCQCPRARFLLIWSLICKEKAHSMLDLFRNPVKVSLVFLVMGLIMGWRLGDLKLGAALGGIFMAGGALVAAFLIGVRMIGWIVLQGIGRALESARGSRPVVVG